MWQYNKIKKECCLAKDNNIKRQQPQTKTRKQRQKPQEKYLHLTINIKQFLQINKTKNTIKKIG